MQSRQAKTHSPDTAKKAAEPTQKTASSPVASKSMPAWASALGDRSPAGLFPQGVDGAPNLQAKLEISQPDDLFEREADQVAEQVMRMPEPAAQVQRSSGGEMLESNAPPIVNQTLQDSGRPLDNSTRIFMEDHFGYNFDQVRVHTDIHSAQSAQAVSARAYTVGSNMVFGEGQYAPGTTEGKQLLAHELTHVVQQGTASPFQQPSKQSNLAISSSNDPAEAQANQVAERVIRGQSARVHPGIGKNALSIVHRFESTEHRDIGAEASGNASTDINFGTDREPKYLTYGEMVALAGDYFESLDEIRGLARRVGGTDKIRWARWKAMYEKSEPEPNIDPALKKQVMDRYFMLAAGNISHFSAGGTALDSYRYYHWQALEKAYDSGYNGNDTIRWEEAMTIEAFADHYLTDMFSAGHVRTPRQSIKEWYGQHFPKSIPQFITYMAQHMHLFLAETHPYQGFAGEMLGWSDEAALERTIKELGGPALEAFSLGDIVSMAFHDRESEGLEVVADVDVSGTAVKGGFHFTAKGDTRLKESDTTKNMAVAAVRTSLRDLETIRKRGGEVLLIGVYSTLRNQVIEEVRPYQAERYIPREDTSAANIDMNWHWGKFNKNMRDAVDEAVKGKVANTLEEKAMEQKGVKREALEDFVGHLRRRGIGAIENAIGAYAGGARP